MSQALDAVGTQMTALDTPALPSREAKELQLPYNTRPKQTPQGSMVGTTLRLAQVMQLLAGQAVLQHGALCF